jgi:hypothetical protein
MATGIKNANNGCWLESFDPDFCPVGMNGEEKCGLAVWNPDPAKAMRFVGFIEAFEFWRQESKLYPVRYDGQPNRPLTAVSCEFMELPDE